MLRQRSISSVGVVLFTAIPAFLGGVFFVAAIIILALLGIREILLAFGAAGCRPFRRTAYVAVPALIASLTVAVDDGVIGMVVTAVVLSMLAVGLFRSDPSGALADWVYSVAAVLYIALPLGFAVALRQYDSVDSTQAWVRSIADRTGSASAGLAWIGMVIAVTWLNDTAAYLLGRSFGKAKLAPALSPGKTRVGAVAGVSAGVIAGMGSAWVFGAPINVAVAGGIGLILATVGQIGDLGESLIKRNLGIKDMGTIIPGHGGILDRIDALLFTFPVMFVLVRVLEELGSW